MDRKEIILTGIILATAANLLAALIWKHLQQRAKKELQFCMGDLADPSDLVVKLRDGRNSISQYLWWRFPPSTQQLVKKYDGSSGLTSESLRQTLSDALNQFLDDRFLFDEQRFAQVRLREETQKLIAKRPQDDDDLRYLNRLLLEDAYPSEIVKRSKKRYLSPDVRLVAVILSIFIFVIIFSKSNTTTTAQTEIRNERDTSTPQEIRPREGSNKNSNTSPPISSPDVYGPSRLIYIIRQKQDAEVRKSSGLWAQDNFTDEDLKEFMEKNTVQQIVESLQVDQEFLTTVEAIKSMPSDQQEELLQSGLHTYKRTWTERGLNPKKANPEKLSEGQTEAGQMAEKLIAEGIVNLVRSLLKG